MNLDAARRISLPVLIVALFTGLAACTPVKQGSEQADGQLGSAGFLTNYDLLKPTASGDGVVDYVYVDPNLAADLEKYSGVMVDQPEIIIAADSPYRGAKPEGMKLVADVIRYMMMGEFIRGGYNLVEEPADDIVYLRIGLTDLNVERNAGVSAYIPTQITVDNEAEVARNFMSTLTITEVNVEIEIVNSSTSEVLMAGIANMAFDDAGDDPLANWQALGLKLERIAAGITCVVQTADLPPGAQREICSARVSSGY